MHRVEPDRKADDRRDDRGEGAWDAEYDGQELEEVPDGQKPERTGDKALHVAMFQRAAASGERVARTR